MKHQTCRAVTLRFIVSKVYLPVNIHWYFRAPGNRQDVGLCKPKVVYLQVDGSGVLEGI